MTKFGSADRFITRTPDKELPYKKQLAVSKKSIFEEKEPKGVKFGKDRETIGDSSLLNRS